MNLNVARTKDGRLLLLDANRSVLLEVKELDGTLLMVTSYPETIETEFYEAEGQVTLLKTKKETPKKPEAKASLKKTASAKVKKTLDLIEQSEMKNPNQSTRQRRDESARIAKRVYGSSSRHNIMRVAGVRSARTKGMYD